MNFPPDYDDDLIEFSLNESSWCASNIIPMLEDYDRKHGCICNICEFVVLPLESKTEE